MIRNIRLISKFITSQSGSQAITIHIFIDIWRSKCNQTMKFGQLIEFNMRNIFLEKSYTKCNGETIPRPFFKNSKLSISLDQLLKVLYSFLLYAKLMTIKILKLGCRPLGFTSYNAFLKNKKRSWTSLPASFSTWFLKKNISLVTFYYMTEFHCLLIFTLWDIGQYVYCNCLLTRLWRHAFWN